MLKITQQFRFYEENSFNNRPYGRCVEKFDGTDDVKHYSEANNPDDCTGEWQEFHQYQKLTDEDNEQDVSYNSLYYIYDLIATSC